MFLLSLLVFISSLINCGQACYKLDYNKLTQRYTENVLLRALSLAEVASRTGICKKKYKYYPIVVYGTHISLNTFI